MVFWSMNVRAVTIATSVLAVLASAAVLYALRSIMLPLVLAGLLSILFRPLVNRLRAWKVPSVLCLVIVLLIVSSALWTIYTIGAAGTSSVIEKAPEYDIRVQQLSDQITAWVRDLTTMIYGRPTKIRLENIVNVSTLTGVAAQWLGSVVSFVSDAFLVLLFLVFMIPAGEHFPRKLQAATKDVDWLDATHVYDRVYSDVVRYISVKTIMNAINGLATWALLEAFGVDFAPLLGLLSFLLHYLPNIGSVVSTVLPTVVALLQFGTIGGTLSVTIPLIIVQGGIGNVLEPKVMGKSLDLSPVVVLFALVFWGWMWGVTGMILSVPIMAVIKSVLEATTSTRPLAVLMGERVRD
ncbi:MAG: AI-2E family transporter [Candidatus Kapabacteria bacterium]|nr:AI-2E family transporter [Candidatus Kapabacteria bacterium]